MPYLYYNNQIRGIKIMGLDQYAYSKQSHDSEDQVELAYWRKHNRLQGYMEKLWERKGRPNYEPTDNGGLGDFNCIPVELNASDIEQLEASIHNKDLPGPCADLREYFQYPPTCKSAGHATKSNERKYLSIHRQERYNKSS